ncbi:uncharacterized protein LOC106092422 isoform X2 [Stomoxys calcitrans]|uniref:uncharacterized protein LOC106092422 isoform X2 n=1 Tax=Stomoxys calcitrans TaxID=35570 RepID=UPI0027E292CB|nr:uncharacterized protein LOC106092422 isoform X2 [Stomoxys calcitrans]
MKHIRVVAINRDVKRNHTKKYQHKMNIITFLKSNYKYKRRCTILEKRCNGRCRRQQTPSPHSLFVEKVSNHRIVRKMSLCTRKLSKFPRIFIIIKRSTPTTTTLPIIEPADYRSLSAGPLLRKNAAISKRALSSQSRENYTDDDVCDGIRRQNNAHKDANEDTNIEDGCNHLNARPCRGIGDEWHYQHGNYDKVSTITSSPPLKYRRHHQQQQQTSTTPKQMCPSLAPMMATGRCFTTTFHHPRDMNRPEMPANSLLRTMHQCVNDGHDYIDMDNNISILANAHANNCQLVEQQYIIAGNGTSKTNPTMSLFLTLFIAFAIGVRTTAAGACWQTVLGNGKCNEVFSFNVSKSDCCGANQEFAYTDREPTNVEYFFATAIGGGMECTPCLESCRNVQCGPNKKCVKRKGRPKCVCAPECGATRRRRLQRERQLIHQHLSLFSDDSHRTGPALADMKRSRQSRDTHTSLSSEITKKNRGSGNQNQRKLIHIHMQHDYAHQQEAPPPSPPPLQQTKRKKQQRKGNRRLLITANVEEHTEKPTTRRIQLFSNVRNTYARQRTNENRGNGQHEDTDLSEEYEEDDYDDEDGEGDDGERRRGIIFNSGFNFASGSSSNNHEEEDDDDDDATRFGNQSRHKTKTNKNNHDFETTTAQQRDQNLSPSKNGNNRVRHPQKGARHGDHSPNSNHRQHQQQQHHKHKHRHRSKDDRHGQHHNHNHHHNRQQHSGMGGRRKHHRQHYDKEQNQKDYSSIITTSTTSATVIASAASSNSGEVQSSANRSFIQTTALAATTPQLMLMSTTPVNFTLPAAVASDQRRLTNHGSKMTPSSSLPLYTPASSSSSLSGPTTVAASIHPHVQITSETMPAAAASTSSSATSKYSTSSSFATVINGRGGEGAKATQLPLYPHGDHGGNVVTMPDTFEPSSTAAINSHIGDNDNTISTSHHFDSVSFDSYFDQFDLHGFPSRQHAVTMTVYQAFLKNSICKLKILT